MATLIGFKKIDPEMDSTAESVSDGNNSDDRIGADEPTSDSRPECQIEIGHVQIDSVETNVGASPPDCKIEMYNEPSAETEVAGEVEVPSENKAVTQDSWDHPLEFLCSCISMSIGLGNVWRFPFVAYENGGGAFIAVYVIVLMLIGRPLYVLEMALGQFSSSGPVKVWRMAPFFKGIGFTAMMGTTCALIYYVSLMSISLYYLYESCRAVLPWSRCDPAWTSDLLCVDGVFQSNSTNSSLAELYYSSAFPQWPNIDDGIGLPSPHLALCLFVAWGIISLSLVDGIKRSGKVAYFTTVLPFLALIVVFVRGITLSGAWEGVKEFLDPDWNQVLSLKLWYAALGQVFFSLSTGAGPVTLLASFNKFNHDLCRDAFLISMADTFISLLAGVTTFAIVGSLAADLNVQINEVVGFGPGLAFITFPDAISRLKFVPQLFSVTFYIMLFTLGLGSATAMTSVVATIVSELFPRWKKSVVTLILCLLGFLIGLIHVTPGGHAAFALSEHYGSGFVIYIVVILEISAVCFVYGLTNFCHDFQFMLGVKVSLNWRLSWGLIIPCGLSLILVHILMVEEKLISTAFPASAVAAGWALATISLLFLPLGAVHGIYYAEGPTLWGKIKESLRPTSDWGPQAPMIKKKWMANKYRHRVFTTKTSKVFHTPTPV